MPVLHTLYILCVCSLCFFPWGEGRHLFEGGGGGFNILSLKPGANSKAGGGGGRANLSIYGMTCNSCISHLGIIQSAKQA